MTEKEKYEKEIAQLKESLQMETAVKKSEVLLNGELKQYNLKLQLAIETQSKIISEYADKIAQLKRHIEKLTS
tara:strand:+ start:841 stop:1059 length:219 start_codon:yes stop_codon:yes gene_type:complete